jgi:hypothetical protein
MFSANGIILPVQTPFCRDVMKADFWFKTFGQWKLLLLMCFVNSEKMALLKLTVQESVF